MNTYILKLIEDDVLKIGGLEIKLMHSNKTGSPYMVIEADDGDLLIMEVEDGAPDES